jgi:hemoglobin-like flavoprotein
MTIHTLVANSNRLAEADADLVSALEPLSSLAGLFLRDTQLRTTAVRGLAGSPVAGRLHTLDLAFNQLDDSAADVVSHPPGFHALRTLVLDNNDISFASAASILASPAMPLLQTASFARNALKNVVDLHSLARRKVELLEKSFVQASGDGAHLAERFYARLFERYPAVKPLFAHTSMRRQQQHLTSALTMVIEHLRAPDQVTTALEALAARHVSYGAFPSHYQAVTTTLLDTLKEILGADWTAELDDAWHDGLDAVAEVMVRAQQHATQNQVHQVR